jgi:hypothetical protein
MTDPLFFTSTSPRWALPMLFAGQAQKEFTVNEAHALADLLLHPAVSGEASTPPATPADGECWIVGADATGEWAGRDGALAGRQAGAWLFATPRDGLRVLDVATGQQVLYAGGWRRAAAPEAPAGGTTVDSEARAGIAALVAALINCGIFPVA